MKNWNYMLSCVLSFMFMVVIPGGWCNTSDSCASSENNNIVADINVEPEDGLNTILSSDSQFLILSVNCDLDKVIFQNKFLENNPNELLVAKVSIDDEMLSMFELKQNLSEFEAKVPWRSISNGQHLIKLEIVELKNQEEVIALQETKFTVNNSPGIIVKSTDDSDDILNKIIIVNYPSHFEGIYGYLDIFLDSSLLLSSKIKNDTYSIQLSDLPGSNLGNLSQGNHVLSIKAQAINGNTVIAHSDVNVNFYPVVSFNYDDNGKLLSLSAQLPVEYKYHFVSLVLYCEQAMVWSSGPSTSMVAVDNEKIVQEINVLPFGRQCIEHGFLSLVHASNGVTNWSHVSLQKE